MKKSSRVGLAILLAVFGAVGVLAVGSPKVSAQTSFNVNVDVSGTCTGTVNGSSSTYFDVTPNSTVTLNVTNNDGVVVQDITGYGISPGTQVDNNSKTTNNQTALTLNIAESAVTVTFKPVPNSDPGTVFQNNCPIGSSPVASTLTINPASATLACTTQDANWVLSGTFVGASAGSGVYNGSNKVASITSAGAINQPVPAQTTAQTYTVLDGTNYGGKGTILATVTCPKYVAPAATTTTTPATKDTTTSTVYTGVKVPDNSGGTVVTKKVIPIPPTVVAKSQTVKYVTGASFGVLAILVVLLVLGLLDIWTTPLNLLTNAWHKLTTRFSR